MANSKELQLGKLWWGQKNSKQKIYWVDIETVFLFCCGYWLNNCWYMLVLILFFTKNVLMVWAWENFIWATKSQQRASKNLSNLSQQRVEHNDKKQCVR
jgi:hypothetical protein